MNAIQQCRKEANWRQMGRKLVYRVPCVPGAKMVEHLGSIKERSDGRWDWWRSESAYHETWRGMGQGVALSQGAAEMRVLEGWDTMEQQCIKAHEEGDSRPLQEFIDELKVKNELDSIRQFQEERQMTPEEAKSVQRAIEDPMPSKGVSLSQILTGRDPCPTYILNWGEDMPPHVLQALREGESALLVKDGEVQSMVVYNEIVGMREMSVETIRERNQRMV